MTSPVINRIAIIFDQRGFVGVAADQPVEVYTIQQDSETDRVYLMQSVDIGPQFVTAAMQGHQVGYADDDAGKLAPSRPALTVVKESDE